MQLKLFLVFKKKLIGHLNGMEFLLQLCICYVLSDVIRACHLCNLLRLDSGVASFAERLIGFAAVEGIFFLFLPNQCTQLHCRRGCSLRGKQVFEGLPQPTTVKMVSGNILAWDIYAHCCNINQPTALDVSK